MMTDPIADMLTRIRNAAMAQHSATYMPMSKMKKAIAEILKEEGYVADVRTEEGKDKRPALVVALKYNGDRVAAFRGIRRVSRPGRRVYVGHSDIPRVLSGLGVSILSTSQGLMTDRKARSANIGGEAVCAVW